MTSRQVVAWELGSGGHREDWEGKITQGHEEVWGHDACVLYLDCGHGFTDIYGWQNLSNCALYVLFIVCQLFLNKAVQTYNHKMISRGLPTDFQLNFVFMIPL